MQGNENIPEYGKETQFSKGQSGNPKGRKPSRLKKFLKDFDVPKSDIDILFKNLLFNHSFKELDQLYKTLKKETPEYNGDMAVGMAVLVSGLMHDVRRGDMKVYNSLLDRLYGKATDKIDVSGGMGVTVMIPEERDRRLKELLEKADGHSKP